MSVNETSPNAIPSPDPSPSVRPDATSPDATSPGATSPDLSPSVRPDPSPSARSPNLSSSSNSKKQKMNVNDALNEYYKMKSKYEEAYYDKYIKPILRSKGKSKREKRLDFQKLPKPECINCKRNVGTIFTIKKNQDEYYREIVAQCGDLTDPCPLDINIQYTQRNELNKEILDHDNDINAIKNKIIADKNNMMFGYIDQQKAISSFSKDTSELKDITEAAGYIMDINIQINENPVKTNLIKTSEDRLGNELLMPFKDMVKTFDQTGNAEVLNRAVKFYVDEIVPLTTSIRNLKYEVSYVDFVKNTDLESDEKDDMFYLVQKKNSLYNLEYTLYGSDEVKSFVKGVKGFEGSKTRKLSSGPNQIRRKTRKLKQSIDFVEKDDEAEDEEGEGETNVNNASVVEDPVVDIFASAVEEEGNNEINASIDEAGNVTWLNSDGSINMIYQEIWNSLSPEYKAALSQDEPWMKKTIDYFVEFARLKRENKVSYLTNREFVHPDDILLPPQKIGENGYDYGNAFYNKLLKNKGGIWLTFLPKSQDGSYKQYLDGLASIIGNSLKFTKY
jgi:hypothetical protein